MPPKEKKPEETPANYIAADWWRWKYNMRLDKAKEIMEFVRENNLKDTKSLLK